MSTALYSHTTRAPGTILTATIYNTDHVNHITNGNPSSFGALSDNTTQMQSTADPGEVGTESLAGSLAGEIQRLRHMIKEITGKTQWYETPDSDLSASFELVNDTTPQLGGDLDTNEKNTLIDDEKGVLDSAGNELLLFLKVASAINYLKLTNSAAGNPVLLNALGGDTDISLNLIPKGAGNLLRDGNIVWDQANLAARIAALTEDTGPDVAADFVLARDATDGSAKKVLLNKLGARTVTTLESGSLPAAALDDYINIPDTYREILLVILGASFANTATPVVQASVNNGSSFDSGSNYIHSGGEGVNTNLLGAASIAASVTFDIVVRLRNFQGLGYAEFSTTWKPSTGTPVSTNGFYIGSTNNIDALRLTSAVGSVNFDAGTYALYGIL